MQLFFVLGGIALSFFLVGGQKVFAQVQAQNDASDISMTTDPETPRAFENVTFKISSFSVDLDRSSIRWNVDGKEMLAGIGQKTFSVNAGAVGSQMHVSALITTPLFETIEKAVLLAPGDVDILMESVDGYVPPFYKGRPLPVKESLIRLVAMPSMRTATGTYLQPNDFVYTWARNDSNKQNASGYAKNEYIITQDYLNPNETISVTAAGVRNPATAKSSYTLSLFKPKIIFYEDDPLAGIQFQNGITNQVSITQLGKTLVAFPYYLSMQGLKDKQLSYEWVLNNAVIPTPKDPFKITLQGSPKKGTASLSLKITPIVKLFQEASAHLSILLQ